MKEGMVGSGGGITNDVIQASGMRRTNDVLPASGGERTFHSIGRRGLKKEKGGIVADTAF